MTAIDKLNARRPGEASDARPHASGAAGLAPAHRSRRGDMANEGGSSALPQSSGRSRNIKVLLVSHWFPPSNVIGAVRVGKFAKYLHDTGHSVRVLTADNLGDHSLPVEIPPSRITYVRARRLDEIFDPAVKLIRRLRGERTPVAETEASAGAGSAPAGMMEVIKRHYYALLRIPDSRVDWMRGATAVGYEVVRDWRPDIVLASAPPNSSLIVARRIARVCGAPWIAELRDLWADNPYYEDPGWRLWVDRLIERSVLNSAAGLVTVSPIWAQVLRRGYRQPVACIPNGYVEEDFPPDRPNPPPGDIVSILYTGNIYAGYRDPSPLFQAIELLGAERRYVAVHFYGPSEGAVYGLPAAQAVRDQIFVHDRVSYQDSLSLQVSADVLLLLQWADPRDAGNIPAKFFEYLGAARPILMLGYEHGNLADMVREREAGLVANDPAIIARQLRLWIAQRPTGIPPVDPKAREGMTRAEQFARLERFLDEVLDKG
jgi:hypothetical protein